jgi:hypothetical protein
VEVSALGDVIASAPAHEQSAALQADGTAWVWGANAAARLGRGVADARDRSHPPTATTQARTDWAPAAPRPGRASASRSRRRRLEGVHVDPGRPGGAQAQRIAGQVQAGGPPVRRVVDAAHGVERPVQVVGRRRRVVVRPEPRLGLLARQAATGGAARLVSSSSSSNAISEDAGGTCRACMG